VQPFTHSEENIASQQSRVKKCELLQIQVHETGKMIVGTEKHVAEGKICSRGDFVKWLDVLVSQANCRPQSQTTSLKFARSRLIVGALLGWIPFQIMVGVILVVNFGLEVHMTQAQDIILTI
jgi:hypothetical protein